MSSKQRLVLSIIDFLNQSIQDGTIKQDDQESLEVAVQCIGEAFGVDPIDETQRERLSVKPATLPTIFDLFLKTRDKMAPPPAAASAPSTSAPKIPSTEDKTAAETFKASGNSLMSSKKYDEAIEAYTKAIALDSTNPVYHSNRAAAHSSKGDHKEAIEDAEKAIEVDPSFVKAYHRLGHAHYCLNEYKEAAVAFRRGLELDPDNTSLKSGLVNAESRISEEEDDDDDNVPPLDPVAPPPPAGGMAGMADMLRNMGMGGGGPGGPAGGGGMPDLAGLMNNPMMMQMAQQMMQNGGLERMMSNPAVANMMNRMQSGGGMPSMADIMSDPTMRDMANQLGAGGAGRGA